MESAAPVTAMESAAAVEAAATMEAAASVESTASYPAGAKASGEIAAEAICVTMHGRRNTVGAVAAEAVPATIDATAEAVTRMDEPSPVQI